MKNDNLAIKLDNIVKKYHSFSNKRKVVALDEVSLKIKKGEKIGISGDNGAGKTTLLKIIAGITNYDSGNLITNGSISSLINLNTGFCQEMSGEENIILQCLIHGMDKKTAKSLKEKIIKFADIGNYIKAPFYTYSNGMKFRLSFSIAIHSNSNIILLDELFIAGDMDFQIKTFKKIEQLAKNKQTTLLISSHYPLILRKFCNRTIVLKKGKISQNSKNTILKLVNKWNSYFADVPMTEKEKEVMKNKLATR